jgi:vacuolar-type H+-ATPase subunit F/Vma7
MAINTDSVISNIYSTYTASSKTEETEETSSSKSTGKTGNYGRTIGDAKLSDEGAKYYEELKKKYSNVDFILVSEDQKENAQANAASYANSSKMVVLIDEDKVERMATDENYRKQYEAIISNASSGVSQLKASIESSGLSSRVQGYGMQVNDGGTSSFFAVLKKSSADQKARIEKKAEEKKAEKKAAEKKAEKKEQEEDDDTISDNDDTVTITANSIEELIQKINDYTMAERSDSVQTDYEKTIGQNIDIKG